jgi:hypothetical protein
LVNKRNLLHEAREWSYPDETSEATVNPPPSTPAVRADTRERVPVIDIGIALDLLAAAMQQRGPDFVYRPTSDEESKYLPSQYANNDPPDGIVGQALALADVDAEKLDGLGGDGVEDLYLPGMLPFGLTLGALAVLRTARQSQDRGCRSDDVLAHATATALRILDLLPDAAFEPHWRPPPETNRTTEHDSESRRVRARKDRTDTRPAIREARQERGLISNFSTSGIQYQRYANVQA